MALSDKLLAPERPVAAKSEENLYSVSMVGALDGGEVIASVTDVVELDTTDLTITNKVVSTAVLAINHRQIPIGKAIQFLVKGQLQSNSPYILEITFVTDSLPAQTKHRYVKFHTEEPA